MTMRNDTVRQTVAGLLRLVRTLVLIDLAFMAGALALCWPAGWPTLSQYGQSLVYLGAACVLIGCMSVGGQFLGVRGNAQYFIAGSASAANMAERTRQMMADLMGSYRFVVVGALSGLSLIALGALLDHLAR